MTQKGKSPKPSVMERLRRSEEYRLLLVESLTDYAVLTLSVSGKITQWNGGSLRILGYTGQQIERLAYSDIFSSDDKSKNLPGERLAATTAEGETRYNQAHVRKDGSSFWAESVLLALKDGKGKLRGFVQVFHDTTGAKKAEEALQLKDERYALMLDSIQDYAIFTLNLEGCVTSWNKGAERVKGYTAEEVLGKHFRIFYTPEERDFEQPEREIQQAIALGRSENEYWRVKKDGSRFWGNEIITSLRDEEGVLQGFVKVTRDMTERKQAEELIRHQSFHDPLTNLPNRRLGEEWLVQAMAMAERNKEMVAVLICDLDHFKHINDTYGHPVGDLVLKEVSRRLLLSVRKEDMVVRLGGDEFLLFLPQLKRKADIEKVIRKIISSVRASIRLSEADLQVGVSVGIAFYPADGSSAGSLIKKADLALYQAKEHGRNNYEIYVHSSHRKANKGLAMGKSLHEALKKKEFVLYYQPIIDLKSGETVRVEALLRWLHPDHGLVFPDEFMPLAEEAGLASPLSWWVLEAVCKQIKAWEKEGFRFGQVSFNVSPLQFGEIDLPEKVAAMLKRKRVAPSLIQMEIIENSLMQDIPLSIEKLKELRETSIQIAVDDFGTGYSSLSYLQQLPVDGLKIDRSFIRACTDGSRGAALATMIIELGHALGLQVCAEGIETAEQLSFVTSAGCDTAQGFLIQYPLPAAELSRASRSAAKKLIT
jgi:diguanylate cyclase (GGDEF)-like protein/PAS domain S-box-containing protein